MYCAELLEPSHVEPEEWISKLYVVMEFMSGFKT